MFHGYAKRLMKGHEKFYFARNSYIEPALRAPVELLAVREDLAEMLRPYISVKPFEFTEEFVFYLPYVLGKKPPSLSERVYARIEQEMEQKNTKLLPSAISNTRCLAINPVPVKDIDPKSRVLMSAIQPSDDPEDSQEYEWNVICDERVIDKHGLVRGGFGYQMSPVVYDILKPYLKFPYYRVMTRDV
jgi:hypothetical protein